MVKESSTINWSYDPAEEIAIIRDIFPPIMLVVIRNFYCRFVRTLNTTGCDPTVKLDITISCPVNPVVVNGCKSNENPISLLFVFTR
jgi:hypothetical protein